MLSICIPIYKQEVSELTNELHLQAVELSVDAEICLLDDGSDDQSREANRSLGRLPLVRYEELARNAGRSRVRNLLAKMARHPYLLFLDGDTRIIRKDFLKVYLSHLASGQVLCGGHVYGDQPADNSLVLHWLVGSKREVRPAAERNKRPYLSFMTGNFLIQKALFAQLGFRENLEGYGHEDTLFGFDLMKQEAVTRHIDNPVLHAGLDAAERFLEKTREGLENLQRTWELSGRDPRYLDMVRIMRTYQGVRSLRLCQVLRWIQTKHKAGMERRLEQTPSLLLFDLYKLTYLCQIMQSHAKRGLPG